ncbi:hypothetical protein [Paenibacillus sp. QZ-Y1]|uniref:hypothetical protein n=1 Tax=Paenibacillus sp. QZ-Y1 TaxID=3414511 RepID=UPI003F79A036
MARDFCSFPLSRGNPAPKADASLPLLRFRPSSLHRSPWLFKGVLPWLTRWATLFARYFVNSLNKSKATRGAVASAGGSGCGPLLARDFYPFPLSRGNPAPKVDAPLPRLRFRPSSLHRSPWLSKGVLPSLTRWATLFARYFVNSLNKSKATRGAVASAGGSGCGPLLARDFCSFPLSRGNPAPKADASLPLLRFRPSSLHRSPWLFKGVLPWLTRWATLFARYFVNSLNKSKATRGAVASAGGSGCGPLLARDFYPFPLSRGNPAPKVDAPLPRLRFRPSSLHRSPWLSKGVLPSLTRWATLFARYFVNSLNKSKATRGAVASAGGSGCGPLLARDFCSFPLSRGNPAPKADASLPLLRFRPSSLHRSPWLFKGVLPWLTRWATLFARYFVNSLNKSKATRGAVASAGGSGCGPLLARDFYPFPLSRGNPAPKVDAPLPRLRFRPSSLLRSPWLF